MMVCSPPIFGFMESALLMFPVTVFPRMTAGVSSAEQV
jgi:hypothetical protein